MKDRGLGTPSERAGDAARGHDIQLNGFIFLKNIYLSTHVCICIHLHKMLLTLKKKLIHVSPK